MLYILRIYRRTQALLSDGYGPAGAAGAWATPPHPPGPQNHIRDYGPAGAAHTAADSSRPQYLPGSTGRTVTEQRTD